MFFKSKDFLDHDNFRSLYPCHKTVSKQNISYHEQYSSCVPFCIRRGLHPYSDIFIGSTQIPIVDNVHYLGLHFDNKPTFLPHILQLQTKCEKSLNLLKVLSNTSWEADHTSLLKVYRAVIILKLVLHVNLFFFFFT